MTVSTGTSVYYDPFDPGIDADPYPVFRRLRDEAPAYYNERYDFWALSRHGDVQDALVNWQLFSSARGDVLEVIQANVPLPPGVLMFEDPPLHRLHRGLLSRVFTPRRMALLADQIREFCARCLDPLVGSDGFDVIAELGAEMPMRVIGMLLGVPEDEQVAIRERTDRTLRTEAGQPMKVKATNMISGGLFTDYIEWRAHHPSDDLMTALLTAEFEDETGTTRRLSRAEVLNYTSTLAGAGNETTGRLIGWLAKLLAEHPDQRRQIVADPSLVPQTIEEALRVEPPGPHACRVITADTEYHDRVIPAGTAVMLLVGAANHDERRYADPDAFDIHRPDAGHLTFGHGLHFCLGANLARLEGQIALEEMLRRFPDWSVDYDNIKLAPTSTVRGWERMPIVLG